VVLNNTAAAFRRKQAFKAPDGTAAEKKKNMEDAWVSKTTQYVLEVSDMRNQKRPSDR
jgi:hypothetical protein